MMKKSATILTVLLLLLPLGAGAQQVLTLEDCRRMAVENDKTLDQARVKVEMAGYDRKVALANYFPNVSAKGAYLYNNENIDLISDGMSAQLTGIGTAVQGVASAQVAGLTQAIMANPLAAQEYMRSPMWQTVLGALSKADLSEALNAVGAQVDEAFHLDVQNVYVGAVTLQQPVFAGGKIVAANRIAALAQQLAEEQYETAYQQTLYDVDQAYWQIVSIAAKQRLAESYADLLHQMERHVLLSIEEGVATEADALTIRVKANEADMLLTKSSNGLALAKMLLCKQVGLALDTDITLADEHADVVPVPQIPAAKPMDDIYADRAEVRSLALASQIYDSKVDVARADMLPTVALTANYLLTNPSLQNGFTRDWGGRLCAGVVVSVPLFHAGEALNKTRKARAEASLYRLQLDDVKEKVHLQVQQLRDRQTEALERVTMTGANLDSAEENLRIATVGFEEGVVDADVALAAQTAWLQAHSDYIDAGIELQMTRSALDQAEGNHRNDN